MAMASVLNVLTVVATYLDQVHEHQREEQDATYENFHSPLNSPIRSLPLSVDPMDSPRTWQRLKGQMALNGMSHEEKDTVIKRLVQQVNEYQQKLNDVSDFGKNIASRLILAQV